MSRDDPSGPKPCMDCQRVRAAEAFYKTQGGYGRSDRCRDCIEVRAERHRADKQRAREEEDAELEAFLSVPSNGSRPLPIHLVSAFNRLEPRPTPRARKLSNRPQMARCAGCGEAVPKRDLWEYRRGLRSRYCKPCMKRRAVERECEDCQQTKLTPEFFGGVRGVSPYCSACRDKRTREKHCPRCGITKSATDFNQSGGKLAGWCKQCSVAAQRERRAAARTSRD